MLLKLLVNSQNVQNTQLSKFFKFSRSSKFLKLNLSKWNEMQGQKGKCKDDTKSDSLDRCEHVERSKTYFYISEICHNSYPHHYTYHSLFLHIGSYIPGLSHMSLFSCHNCSSLQQCQLCYIYMLNIK